MIGAYDFLQPGILTEVEGAVDVELDDDHDLEELGEVDCARIVRVNLADQRLDLLRTRAVVGSADVRAQTGERGKQERLRATAAHAVP